MVERYRPTDITGLPIQTFDIDSMPSWSHVCNLRCCQSVKHAYVSYVCLILRSSNEVFDAKGVGIGAFSFCNPQKRMLMCSLIMIPDTQVFKHLVPMTECLCQFIMKVPWGLPNHCAYFFPFLFLDIFINLILSKL